MKRKNQILLCFTLITAGILTSCNLPIKDNTDTKSNTIVPTISDDTDLESKPNANTKPVSMKLEGLKESYGLGSLIDISDLSVVISFNDNSIREFTMYNTNITYEAFDTDSLGTHEIKIKYKDFEETFTYNVKLVHLTLDFNDGCIDGLVKEELIAEKNIVSLEGIIPTPNEEGMKFAGWFYDKEATKRVEFAIDNELSIEDDITIYAGYDTDYTDKFDYEVVNNEVRLIKLKSDYLGNEIIIPITIDLYPVTIIGEEFTYNEDFAFNDDPWGENKTLTLIFEEDINKHSCVRIIEKNAFNGTPINNVIFPDTIERIDDYAFYFTSIENLTLPKKIKSIGNYAFAYNFKLTNIDFNDSDLISIGNYAFSNCSDLNQIKLSNKIEIIGSNAFEFCTKFKEITLPSSLESIGLNTFAGLPNLEAINVDENNKKFKSIDGNLYSYDETVFYKYCFGKKGKEFIMPSKVKVLFDGAFNISNEKIYLENLILNEGLVEIGDLVFENTTIDFTIPSTVTAIGQKAFYGWKGEEFKISPNNKTFSVINKSLIYHQYYNGKETCVLYSIPEGYSDSSYKLDDSIKIIDSYACKSLNVSSFIIPSTSNLVEIRDLSLDLTSFPNLKYFFIEKDTPFKISNSSFYHKDFKLNESFSIVFPNNNLDLYKESWQDIKLDNDEYTLFNTYVKSLYDYIDDIVVDIANGVSAPSYEAYLKYKEFVTTFDYEKYYYELNIIYKDLLSLLDFKDSLYPETLEYVEGFVIDIINSAADLYKDIDNKDLIIDKTNFGVFYSYYNKTPEFIKNKISNTNKELLENKYEIYFKMIQNIEEINNDILNFEYNTHYFDIDKYNDLNKRMDDNNYYLTTTTDNLFNAYNILDLQYKLYLFNTIEYTIDNAYYLNRIYYSDFSSSEYFYGIEFYLNIYINEATASKLYGYSKLDENLAKLFSLNDSVFVEIEKQFNEEEPINYDREFYLEKINTYNKLFDTSSLSNDLKFKFRLYSYRYYSNEFISLLINPNTNEFYNSSEIPDEILVKLADCAAYYNAYNSNYYDDDDIFIKVEEYKKSLPEYNKVSDAIGLYNGKYFEIYDSRNPDNEDFSIEKALINYNKYFNFITVIGEDGFYQAMIVVQKINSLKDITLSSKNYKDVFKLIEGEINPIFNDNEYNVDFYDMFNQLIDNDAYEHYLELAELL